MVTKLANGVWQIDLRGVNAYILEDGDAVTLVDAGMPWHADRVAAALRAVAGGPAAVERILLTHYDLDHVGAFGRVDALDAPVYAGEPDGSYLSGAIRPPLKSRKSLFQRVSGIGVRPPAAPVRTVDDGEPIGGFTAIHSPGHTPGHVAFIHENLATVVLGDLVHACDGCFKPSPWVLSDDSAAVQRSIRRLAERAPAFEHGLVGHGTPVIADAGERFRRLT